MYTVNTAGHDNQIKEFIAELQNWFEKSDLYDELSNQDILEYHYDDKVYQFGSSPLSSYDVNTIISNTDGTYRIILRFRNGKSFDIGTIEDDSKLNEHLEDSTCEPRLYVRGGRYKKVVVDKDGTDHIKSFREPYKFQIEFLKKVESNDVNYIDSTTAQQMLEQNKWYQASQKAEKFGNTMESAGNSIAGCGCLLILLVTIPVILLLFFIL
ncbi:hypothetical protein H5S40_03530 [Limosilactobacillus sp. RRLNB_1_1]|uniref:Uncharacterized protein n=1 Tax=Limosilactobacillus albertensis TaxID=2759752 RepID=A0A7W3TQW7_9LACO|nr:hypothetical protein [Limosilactobacillus albertensis]MBB1069225.1 hypothetical protein [Limosilactobacillus albertensis]MCD7118477.1 hypothetical protein [Limosilactobacillus albertensis]MCD7128620.1 hypothetical protein [Limosilactobacillus albertensis]